MGGEQAQFAHARLEVVCALDMVDRGRQRRHFLHAGARVGAGEVLAHTPAQVDRRPDVQHLRRRPPEEIDARAMRQRLGEMSVEHLRCGATGDRQRLRLGIVVAKHERCDIVGHVHK